MGQPSIILHPLEEAVVVAIHAEGGIHLLCTGIADVHIESYAGIFTGFCKLFNMLIKSRVHPLPTEFLLHVNRLYPGNPAITPIAPFVEG